MSIFWYSFLILTILHPIGDFSLLTSNRKLHYLIVLNPLHFLWDILPFRLHGKYSMVHEKDDVIMGRMAKYDNLTIFHDSKVLQLIIPTKFWRLLAIDQLAHVLLNVVFAGFLEMFL